MSKSLYPTTLFHFTKSKRAFNNIIKSSFFKVSYARETIKGPTSKREFGIPMISFCDIRLSQLEKHTNSYGRFGIGLSKEWAVKNGLNPVVYMSDGCSAFDDYNQQLKRLKKIRLRIKKSLNGNKNSAFTFLNEEYRSVIGIMRYMKNYSGNLERVGKKNKNKLYFCGRKGVAIRSKCKRFKWNSLYCKS
ncbi:abortive infection system antitoxin AbiGi family protein [Pectobacterium parvum]|uniref:Uncharacterized protein n=1 Tax=Pectobacterium parvum TaxID=2778550 RepID=A0AAP9LE46_9GAMM|nr:abortive infection system antitoxin AbiGi family protein [Pectobacterium parvum]QHQ25860.1 hypothetical protein GMX10_18875 [Pectobacterium parvum]